jgi:hypothetical protein
MSAELYVRGRQRPMLGRLPWFAFERRSRALRFLVFFDIGTTRYEAQAANPTGVTQSAVTSVLGLHAPCAERASPRQRGQIHSDSGAVKHAKGS